MREMTGRKHGQAFMPWQTATLSLKMPSTLAQTLFTHATQKKVAEKNTETCVYLALRAASNAAAALSSPLACVVRALEDCRSASSITAHARAITDFSCSVCFGGRNREQKVREVEAMTGAVTGGREISQTEFYSGDGENEMD